MAKGKRRWQPREMQMVTEFLTKFYADRRWKTRVRLGSPPEALITPERVPTLILKTMGKTMERIPFSFGA